MRILLAIIIALPMSGCVVTARSPIVVEPGFHYERERPRYRRDRVIVHERRRGGRRVVRHIYR